MATAGIVAEYNPFHRGHAWHIARTRRTLGADTAVICVMSGHWVQRGECALTDKWSRAALALSGGELAALGLEVVPGQANYLLFRAAGAADLNDRILTRGVLIRSCANYHGLGNDWYRVCVGQAEQNRRLLAALKEVL